MNRIPIVFAFDNNLVMPAAVCLYSLFVNAHSKTTYDVIILHHEDKRLNLEYIDKVFEQFPSNSLRLIPIGDTFDSSFEIRGITTAAYYRLLIPNLLPEYDKVLYSDVDVIFRDDLSQIYLTDLDDNYIGGVNSVAFLDKDLNNYYVHLGLDPHKVIYSGNLIFNCKKLRENPQIITEFIRMAANNYKYQDMDIINLVCRDKITFIGPEFCLSTYICQAAIYNKEKLYSIWSDNQIEHALTNGIIHYNGQKPWKGYCVNFDIWWEYFRKSPIFNKKYYFDFFYGKLDEYDRLPILKRIKILARYFIYGRKY